MGNLRNSIRFSLIYLAPSSIHSVYSERYHTGFCRSGPAMYSDPDGRIG